MIIGKKKRISAKLIINSISEKKNSAEVQLIHAKQMY